VSEVRESRVAIEEGDLDVVRGTRLTEFSARRVNGSGVGGFKSEIDLGGGSAAEALVRTVGVVGEGPVHEGVGLLGLKLRRKRSEDEGLEGAPESLEPSVGAMVSVVSLSDG